MEHRKIIFRLYSELESLCEEPIYDVLEIGETVETIDIGVNFDSVDRTLISYLKSTGTTIILNIPAEIVREIPLGAVPGSTKKSLSAAPFLVEEFLPYSLSASHVTLRRDLASKHITAFVIQQESLRQCLEVFSKEAIRVDCVIRDVDNLTDNKRPFIHVIGNRAIIGTSKECTALSLTNSEFYLEALSKELSTSELSEIEVLVYTSQNRRISPLPNHLTEMPTVYITEDWFLQQFQLTDTCTNLAPGIYASENSSLGFRQAHWVFLCCLCLTLIALASTYYGFAVHLTRLSHHLVIDQQNIYKQLFPQDKIIVNIRAQVAQHLAAMELDKHKDGFNELFYPVLEQYGSLAGRVNGEIRHLHYQSAPPGITIEILTTSAKVVDELEQELSKLGLSTLVESIRQEGDAFLGRIQVSKDCKQC
ncbi:MAG: type II secretion system protein GspL [Halioglobus sp.]